MKDKSELHTRTRLRIAAERVFALYRVEGATSRMIVAEAKQRNQSALTTHLEARCAVGPWKARKAELDAEIELMVDGFSGFMRAPRRAVAPTSIKILERKELEMKSQAALL